MSGTEPGDDALAASAAAAGSAGTAGSAGAHPVALVAGSGGVIGRAVVERFVRSGIRTRGLSRRRPERAAGWEHVPADLLAPAATRDALAAAGAGDTTRLVFAAYVEKAHPVEQIDANVALLRNALDALAAVRAPLEHVTLYQGMKYYGAHLGAFATPAREDDPRLIVPNFYYDQEDLLQARAAERGFAVTLFRPEGVMGHAQGTPMNLLMVLAAYVAVSRELGLPLRFPGPRAAYDGVLYQMSDAALLARATEWAAGASAAHGEAFNVTNGDVIRWRQLFTAIAAHYGMPLGEPQPFRLAESMPLHEPVWDAMVARHGLVPTPWATLVDWRFGDAIFGATSDNVSSTIKLRRAGFAGCLDTIDRTLELLDDLAARRVVPAAGAAAATPDSGAAPRPS